MPQVIKFAVDCSTSFECYERDGAQIWCMLPGIRFQVAFFRKVFRANSHWSSLLSQVTICFKIKANFGLWRTWLKRYIQPGCVGESLKVPQQAEQSDDVSYN